MKIASVRGKSVEGLMHEKDARIAGWALRREYRSTFRGAISTTEKLVGRAGSRGASRPGRARRPSPSRRGLRATCTCASATRSTGTCRAFPVRTVVGSIRSVEWRRLEPNFFVVFPEGVLEAAPKTYLAAAHAASPSDSAKVQRAVVDAFPNVTAIDLALVVETLDGIFSKVAFAVQFMALFTVATGLIDARRLCPDGPAPEGSRETVLLRTLGASRRQLAMIQLVEYAALGAQAAVVGSLLAVAGNALLAEFVFHVPPFASPWQVAGAAVSVSVLAWSPPVSWQAAASLFGSASA